MFLIDVTWPNDLFKLVNFWFVVVIAKFNVFWTSCLTESVFTDHQTRDYIKIIMEFNTLCKISYVLAPNVCA